MYKCFIEINQVVKKIVFPISDGGWGPRPWTQRSDYRKLSW